jgi:hypothetical protein
MIPKGLWRCSFYRYLTVLIHFVKGYDGIVQNLFTTIAPINSYQNHYLVKMFIFPISNAIRKTGLILI